MVPVLARWISRSYSLCRASASDSGTAGRLCLAGPFGASGLLASVRDSSRASCIPHNAATANAEAPIGRPIARFFIRCLARCSAICEGLAKKCRDFIRALVARQQDAALCRESALLVILLETK